MIEKRQVESLIFEKTLLAFTQMIPAVRISEWQAGLSLRAIPYIASEYASILSVWFLSAHKTDVLTERDTVEFPASPWEFLKQKYAPKWFLIRYPVKTVTKTFRVAIHHHYVCPHIEVPSDKGPHVHYEWMGKMSGQIPPEHPI